ncbi:MAG: hypothetical protein UZ11_BCD004000899 [Bacteroidetes bacterium OLB11]|nr:MAG: hypothetical protein UZ11_BCD004000899 [Bacteroidetes bacterium OLB11]
MKIGMKIILKQNFIKLYEDYFHDSNCKKKINILLQNKYYYW